MESSSESAGRHFSTWVFERLPNPDSATLLIGFGRYYCILLRLFIFADSITSTQFSGIAQLQR